MHGTQLLSLSEGERITSVIPVSEFPGDQYLLMLTVNGYIKKVSLNAFSAIRVTGIIAIQLVLVTSSDFLLMSTEMKSFMYLCLLFKKLQVPGDELKWVRRCADDDLVVIASQKGRVIVNSCNTVRYNV